MSIHINTNCISADVQADIEPPPIPLIKVELEEEKASDIIRINMRWNPKLSASEMYKLKISTFKNGKPEEFLALMNNFKNAIDRTGTTSMSGSINCIRTMLCG